MQYKKETGEFLINGHLVPGHVVEDIIYDRIKSAMDIAIEKQEQGEPVTWSSPQRTWVGLTHEEHMEIMTGSMTTLSRMAAVEAKLREKNI